MELDELKAAWQVLGDRLERQEAIQWQLLRDRKLDRVRASVRPLFWGQALQAMLGIGLLVLGVACWGRNTDVPGLFATGIVLHAFGVVTMVMAIITMSLIGTMAGAYFANKKSAALIAYRLEQLEQKVAKHNGLVERTYHLEEAAAVFEEKLKVANHRIDDLEHGT